MITLVLPLFLDQFRDMCGHLSRQQRRARLDGVQQECRAGNSNGIIHNMIIHELALLTTFYNVTASNIASVEADTDFSLLVRTPHVACDV